MIKEKTDLGFNIVTRDYMTEESYSGDEEPEGTNATTTRPKAKPVETSDSSNSITKPVNSKPAVGASAGGKKAGQGTLQGFFKKK